MGVERPPGDDEDQFPAVDALRRALRRGVRDGANSDVDGLNALVLEWGIVRTLAGPPDARHWVGHAATPGWGPALAASTIPPVLDLHASGAITRLGWCASRWCGRPFLPPKRGRPQRFCCARCANWVRQSRGRHGTELPYVRAPNCLRDGTGRPHVTAPAASD
ncbi:hypothetical protein [Propioniciclava sp.]|uniref:hypothetical protein n=1 Tax=Propioniciclava sp. TaxID=2038686 RepID=UPI00262AF243|nr:hypothetical protein [Propioniciclava sp.]